MQTYSDVQASATAETEQATSYRFGVPGQMSSDQIRAIALVNDSIARRLSNMLGAWLRTQIHVQLSATDPMAFSEYLRAMPNKAYVYVLRLEPLGGMALLELDLALVQALIDVLLGGKGAPAQVRDMTELEETIFASALNRMMREVNAAWESIGLRFTIERRAPVLDTARLLEPGERTLSTVFRVRVEESTAEMRLCLPAVVLNSIHRRLLAVSAEPRRRFEGAAERVAHLLGDGRVPLVLRLPAARISSSELQALEPGYVLPLGIPRFTPAELQSRGVCLRTAVPVGRGDFRAALLQQTRETPTLTTTPALPEKAATQGDAL